MFEIVIANVADHADHLKPIALGAVEVAICADRIPLAPEMHGSGLINYGKHRLFTHIVVGQNPACLQRNAHYGKVVGTSRFGS